MIWQTFFYLSAVFFTDFSGIYCGLLSSIPEKALMSILPFDPSIGLSLYKTLPVIFEKFEKLQNASGGSVLGMLAQGFFPKTMDESDILFYLYNPKSKMNEPLSLQDISETKGKIFFVVHGWIEDAGDANWHKELAEGLIGTFTTSQVVFVDWGSSANTFIYQLAVRRTKAVGEFMAQHLVELLQTKEIPLEDIVLIGFDLGAQVCGIAGQYFLEATNTTLPLIIGLDPSGPLFQGIDEKERLDETDAGTVMVVHTDTSLFGYKNDSGTIDFYPNGGYSQPGCETANLFCSHRRSYELFISAISNPKKFAALQCNDYEEYQAGNCQENKVYFGDITETKAGKYFFVTTESSPFYKTFGDMINPLKWG